jgi:hypothetical protein
VVFSYDLKQLKTSMHIGLISYGGIEAKASGVWRKI